MADGRRWSYSRSRVARIARVLFSRRERPYSTEWQLRKALARCEHLEDELRAAREETVTLYGRLEQNARSAANEIVTAYGGRPVFDREDPEMPDAESGYSFKTPEDLASEENERRRSCRLQFSELMGVEYELVLRKDSQGLFEHPDWAIYDPRWWATIGKAMIEAKKATEGINVNAL